MADLVEQHLAEVPLSWSSWKLQRVATRSTMAEIQALTDTLEELNICQLVLHELLLREIAHGNAQRVGASLSAVIAADGKDWVRRCGHQSIFGIKSATVKQGHRMLLHPTSSRKIQIRNRWGALRRHATVRWRSRERISCRSSMEKLDRETSARLGRRSTFVGLVRAICFSTESQQTCLPTALFKCRAILNSF